MSRRLHMHLSVRGALNWPKRELRRACAWITRREDGSHPTPEQLRDFLMDELAAGHEALPFGEPCEGFDYKTGCPGHEVPETDPAAPRRREG